MVAKYTAAIIFPTEDSVTSFVLSTLKYLNRNSFYFQCSDITKSQHSTEDHSFSVPSISRNAGL